MLKINGDGKRKPIGTHREEEVHPLLSLSLRCLYVLTNTYLKSLGFIAW